MKILLAEDSGFQRKNLSQMLSENGYEVIQAINGKDALEHIDNGEKFDLLITDLLMPEMNGINLIKELKNNHVDLKVIVLTADIQKTVKEECLKLGVLKFLPKPISENDLISEVKAVLT